MRLLASCQYNGKNYFGWQKQNDQISIQEIIEGAISKILNTKTSIYASGRTDAKVHAISQYFHFDCYKDIDIDKFKYSLNCLLPNDIYITSIIKVDDTFHARYDAKTKIYLYQIYLGHSNVFLKPYVEEIYDDFDKQLFSQSLSLFVGQHDFKNFTSKEVDKDNFIRNIYKIDIKEENNLLKIYFSGDGFVRYMIRYIVGTCINVATKKIDISYVKELLNSKTRNITSYKSEPQGLFLYDVLYKL